MSNASPATRAASTHTPKGRLHILGAAYGLGVVTDTVQGLVDVDAHPQTLTVQASDSVFPDTWPGQKKTLTVVYRYDLGPAQVAAVTQGNTITISSPPAQADTPAPVDGGGLMPLSILGSTYGPADVTAIVAAQVGATQSVSFTANDALFTNTWPGQQKSFVMVYDYGGLPITLVLRENAPVTVTQQDFDLVGIALLDELPYCLDADGSVWTGGTQAWTRLSTNQVRSMSFGVDGLLWCVTEGTVGFSKDFGRTIQPAGAAATQVSASGDGEVWALAPGGQAIRWDGGAWKPQDVVLQQIAVASAHLKWGIRADGELVVLRAPDSSWSPVPPCPGNSPVKAISAGADNRLGAVTADGAFYLYDGRAGAWKQIGEPRWQLRAVALRSAADAWGLTRAGQPVYVGYPPTGRLDGGKHWPSHEHVNYPIRQVTVDFAHTPAKATPEHLHCPTACYIHWNIVGHSSKEIGIEFEDGYGHVFNGPRPTCREESTLCYLNNRAATVQIGYSVVVLATGERFDPSIDNRPQP